MQQLRHDSRSPMVIVDFAHTPDALTHALAAIREHCQGHIIVVFGCGGNRDTGKRAEMGAAAVAGADRVVLTDDNPRDEAPADIVWDILAGTGNPTEVVHDRAEAIAAAIRTAGAGDVVLIAGKGSETTQIHAGQSREFSDLAIARAALGLTE